MAAIDSMMPLLLVMVLLMIMKGTCLVAASDVEIGEFLFACVYYVVIVKYHRTKTIFFVIIFKGHHHDTT